MGGSDIKVQRLGGFALADPVPIEFAGQHHKHPEQAEQQQRAHQQRIVLGTQQPVEQTIQGGQADAEAQAVSQAAQHMADIKADQPDTGPGRQQVRQAKPQMLRQRQQQQIEEGQRNPDQGVLDRVDRQALEYFEQKEASEGQGDKQQGIFDRPVGLEVLVHRLDKTHAKAAGLETVAVGG